MVVKKKIYSFTFQDCLSMETKTCWYILVKSKLLDLIVPPVSSYFFFSLVKMSSLLCQENCTRLSYRKRKPSMKIHLIRCPNFNFDPNHKTTNQKSIRFCYPCLPPKKILRLVSSHCQYLVLVKKYFRVPNLTSYDLRPSYKY